MIYNHKDQNIFLFPPATTLPVWNILHSLKCKHYTIVIISNFCHWHILGNANLEQVVADTWCPTSSYYFGWRRNRLVIFNTSLFVNSLFCQSDAVKELKKFSPRSFTHPSPLSALSLRKFEKGAKIGWYYT